MIHAPLALALLVAAAPPPSPAPVAPAEKRPVYDRVAAVVNGEVITLAELRDRAGDDLRRAERLDAGPARDRAVALALRGAYDLLVAEKLFKAQSAALQLEITDAQVDAAIDDIKKRNRFDDATFEQVLKEQGLEKAGFRAQIKSQLEAMQLLNYKVRSRVKVSDEDLQNYYKTHPVAFEGEEERHVRHIFLPLPEDAAPAQVEKVSADGAKVLQRLAAGEDFAALAKEVSKGPGAEDGGDLGWLRRGTIQKALEDVAFGLADGQVSRLVRAGPGLHLFKVEGRRRGGAKTFDQAKEEIRDLLSQEQTASYRDQYVAELKRDAVIEVNLPELKD
ncbi:MAG TPA: peptidylprolyl isomerase [Anaeromyxobacteraceae bacterium]|nr:peptidylprolyl isomerase [Anaeromyxobacteraceae bacterium]